MISFEGIVRKFYYRSKKDDGFCVALLENENGKIKVKGYLPLIYYGFYLSGTGEVDPNGSQGDTITIKSVNIRVPDKTNYISGYLMSLLGIGFKENTEEDEPQYEEPELTEEEKYEFEKAFPIMDELCECFGTTIINQLATNFDYVNSFCTDHGWFNDEFYNLERLRENLLIENEIRSLADELRSVNPEYAKFAISLFRVFYTSPEMRAEYNFVCSCISENPYVFCFRRNLQSFTFEVADAIAAKYELPKDSYYRCCAGIKHAFLNRIMSEGHVFTAEDRLLHESMEVLKVVETVVNTHIHNMYRNQVLLMKTIERVYLKEYYDMEVYVAEKLNEINRQKCTPNLIVPNFKKIEEDIGIKLTADQREVIKTSVNSNISLITGGPGTGKTTIVRGIIAALRAAGECSIKLAAPTGKAAVRLKESTKSDAQTIHRMLGIKPDSYRQDIKEKISGFIIIDEASMIGIDTMDKLMYSIELPAHLILVGDADQLPSVDPGYVFHDIIESGIFSNIKLTRVFRQGNHSSIKALAENIINGEMIQAPIGESDYHFVKAENMGDISKKVIETIHNLIEQGYDKNDIQVLTPVKDKACGAKELNDLLQKQLNPMEGYAYRNREETIYSGDRVMQTQNDYNFNVFNGEITNNTEVGWDTYHSCAFLKALFPPNATEAYYNPGKYNAEWVTRAYAITVHKSQGSEYPVVIMPVFSNRNMYRNLIYTAATRAKEQLIFIGFEKDLEEGIMNTTPVERNTYLTARIQNNT